MKKIMFTFVALIVCLVAQSRNYSSLDTASYANALLPTGEGVFSYSSMPAFADRPIDVHYYIPQGCKQDEMRVIFVFHGADRGWESLLDAWEVAAEKNHFMVFIPHFTGDKFPLSDYQEIGVMDKDHALRKHSDITPVLIDSLFSFIRSHTVNCPARYSIYGHSAGGQFVQRYLMTNDSPWLDRAVVGSPGWYTFPDEQLNYPYGIQNVPYITDESLRKMFSRDVTVELSEGDTVREWLRKTPEAEMQGRNRLERGINFYDYCRKLCLKKGWDFNWRRMIVPKLGHQSVEMGMAALPILLQPSPLPFHTPTLSLKDSTRFATNKEIEMWMDSLVEAHPDLARKMIIGQTNGGRKMSLLILGNGKEGVKVWLQGGLHGNEAACPEVMCYSAAWMLNSREGRELLRGMQIAVMPVANPDGYDKLQRLSGDGNDLNRDQDKAMDPLTAVLKKAWIAFSPDVSLDLHEFNPHRKELQNLYGHKLETDYDVLLLPSLHPNINGKLKKTVCSLLVPTTERSLKERGYKTGIYFTPKIVGDSLYINFAGKSPRSSSTWCGLADAVSFFAEIKGIGYGRHLLEKRVDCGFTVVRNLLEQTSLHHNAIMKAVRLAKEETLADTAKIVVSFAPESIRQSVDFYDMTNGKRIKIKATALDAMHVKPVVVRNRPKKYDVKVSDTSSIRTLLALGFKCEKTKRHGKTMYRFPTAQPRGNLLVTLMEKE